MAYHEVCPTKPLTLEIISGLLRDLPQLKLSAEAEKRVDFSFKRLQEITANTAGPIYGVNTGFGDLKNKRISAEQLGQLQTNLIMSHACGTGDAVPVEIVRLMLLLKIQGLIRGNSGVQPATVLLLVALWNNNILPVIYEQGSLGASGDLAPLAHLALPLLGKGEVNFNGTIRPAAEVLAENGLKPVKLLAKEGLAILNGTQFMSAWGVWCLLRSKNILEAADVTGALSLDAFDGLAEPFDPRLHAIRPHPGQIASAGRIRGLLAESSIAKKPRAEKHDVQDPYSFRCMPQVHGASRDVVAYVEKIVLTEINSVTDNPTLFPEEGEILSGGNFHGQPLALSLDFLAIALSELASISERRTYLLIAGKRGLPPMLVKDAGLNSGFMIPQYTAASIVSQNKQLCTPASVDSIISSNGQEDHVSMGANAATKCARVVRNVERVLGIEILTAAQALDFRLKEEKSGTSPAIARVHESFRQKVSFLEKDREMYPDIAAGEKFIRDFDFTSVQ
ncbi:MAG TPA: histidine ammonia-lyase [Bacteroidia bacterium]|nr:histidine ammonia-lyase [Bacteroidia bacterium]